MNHKKETILILEDIRSTHNVGSFFRTADAAGVTHIYLVGCTPTPIDKFNRKRSDIAKTALGAEDTIPWTYIKTITPLIKKLQKSGVSVVALEQSPESIDYKKVKAKGAIALIVGNEVTGVSKKALTYADVIAEIPMKGNKESLNVSVAGGIALFRLLNI
jgi:tRNA G18 (ribose-2'-O)-methylase SpoU